MNHLFDFTYRGHEVSILETPSNKYACDIREDLEDGDWLSGYTDLDSQREATIRAIDFVDKYIQDQANEK